MQSLIVSPNYLSLPPRSIKDLKFTALSSSLIVVFNPRQAPQFSLGQRSSFRFGDLRRRKRGPVFKGCKGWSREEGNLALEAEILVFMKKSKKPNAFPTKKELLDAGREDLAEAVVKQGGWLSMGWNLNKVEEDSQDEIPVREIDSQAYLQKIERIYECKHATHSDASEVLQAGSLHTTTSSSCGLSELEGEEDSGIQGILKRLEKQRNFAFGVNLAKNSSTEEHVDKCDYPSPGNWRREDRANFEGSGRDVLSRNLDVSMLDNCNGKPTQKGGSSRNSPDEALCWRTWSIQRAASNAEFEVGEISFRKDQLQGGDVQKKDDDILAMPENVNGSVYRQKSITLKEVQTRLQELELELSSTLHSFRSNSKQVNSHKEGRASSHVWQELSDAWEFQENEIMKANDKLRSLRSKLVVLEGKMAFALFDSQKLMYERRKKVDSLLKAAEIIRTTCVVWPNPASEVLLAGSFDGWTSQRKMEISKTGIFSLWLKLYPGKYEIKFIIDGQWKVDPLRPTVNNNGYENNLLIIT
ncbi:protein PTST homolog 2, chloroplastic-like [Impatiens glandulifera]|uniref:protein PTST homolog 2, chloroplastic-like n=1 Tax=Impatiens glandulifera TaxID=253017 RepID=UPI001FB163F3|nr:protein PTST homolog 2, chloroplastic-like [Impatiens glandulifera]